ncbi:hypothetical protein AQUCO_01200019v1 [Aquilegia coerulea]|uniref:non-specific serine/threonine protein kinase n=1 Tax=Aquilegia coerulea TaxID=218851 RepID=A0A2G5E496_AQUCA|nr:hypothetical protein AQUCO_01200019v1 [Aquilegia coerulea]
MFLSLSKVESKCIKGCDLALASYYVWIGSNLTYVSKVLETTVDEILKYNPNIIDKDIIQVFTRVNVPFSCDCIRNDFLGHVFNYKVLPGNTYDTIANLIYSNLTTVNWLQTFNTYPADRIPDQNAQLNVTVNCSCGDKDVSKDYGLFITYPLNPGETLDSIAANTSIDPQLIQGYNPNVDFSSGSGVVYIPGKDQSEKYPALQLSKGISNGAIAGISIGGIAAVLLIAVCIYVGIFRRKKGEVPLLSAVMQSNSNHHGHGSGTPLNKSSELAALEGLTSIMVDKSVKFSYKELAQATDNFSLANKIGQGGLGAVYYAELRGEKAAIKKMDMQASKEFLAELKVLTHVHHLNLVRLIGYCVTGSLFLVYEFIENGNLSEHLRGSAREPLSWSTRVQIAQDSARGLEYIHEHTVPVYIHRDIKSANILIDKNFHGKVADFGLTKLTEVGSSLQTRLVGTFGYMPPEYAYGKVSPKVDVYAFGVVLYELISGKEAIVKENGSIVDSKGLVALFHDVFSSPDPEDFNNVVDPRLGDNYPFDSIHKMAQLANACTHKNPQLRPSMRSIVVALLTLSSTTEDWDAGSFENQALMNLRSGRYR